MAIDPPSGTAMPVRDILGLIDRPLPRLPRDWAIGPYCLITVLSAARTLIAKFAKSVSSNKDRGFFTVNDETVKSNVAGSSGGSKGARTPETGICTGDTLLTVSDSTAMALSFPFACLHCPGAQRLRLQMK